DNHISIEGNTSLAFSENIPKRFEGYNWHVQVVEDGNDLDALSSAIEAAKAETKRPSIICVRTHIAYGSPMQDESESHGAPLGEDNIRAAKEFYGMPADEQFYVPDEVRAKMEQAIERGRKAEEEWKQRLARYRERFPEQAA